jgi:heterodisulfide reductase subunit C
VKVITREGPVVLDFSFAQEIRDRCQQPIELCYQCKKCTAGCPVSEFTNTYPNQVIRMVQLGLKEKILNSPILWLCVSCETCGARCPNGIRISEIMDALREMAIRRRIKKEKVPMFHQSFLSSVRANGRIHEAVMLAFYKLKSRNFFEDLDVGVKFIRKGKLSLFPSRIKGRKQIKKLFHTFAGGEQK